MVLFHPEIEQDLKDSVALIESQDLKRKVTPEEWENCRNAQKDWLISHGQKHLIIEE